MDAREVALLVLNTCERQGGWSDGTLKKQLSVAGLDSRDAALATQLCFGVIQQRRRLDFYLQSYSNFPLKRMESKVVQSLRLGAYQILFMDRIPHRAAVDSAVELTKKHSKNKRAAGMVNGILRTLSRNLENLPDIPKDNLAEYYGIWYSHPTWMVEELLHRLGEKGTRACLEANNTPVPVIGMVNTTKVTVQQVIESLEGQQVEVRLHPWLKCCLLLTHTGNLEELEAFQKGWFYVQDPASRLAILASGVQPGQTLLDVCAAPGGKSFAAAIQMEGQGKIISCDLHPHKKGLIERGAQRLGLSIITPETVDGRQRVEQWVSIFDVVLVDAPCSGLGVIRKKPDIRDKEEKEVAELPAIQQAILENACAYVKPGGTLLYSTCTTRQQENEGVIADFLKTHSEFQAVPFSLPDPIGEVQQGMLTLWPHQHGTDGFFICKMKRQGEHP